MSIEYLNNHAFETTIARYRKAQERAAASPKEFKEAELELAKVFCLLAKNIVRAFKFQLVDKDDALQEGVMICFEKLHRFDPNYCGPSGKKATAFNFCTTIILNHYRQLYRTAKNYNELKLKYHEYLCDSTDQIHINANKNKKKANNYNRDAR